MLFRERNEIPVEIEARDIGRRVGGIADDERERLRDRMDDRALDRLEELRRRLRRHRADHAARHQEAEGMDRIARIRTQDDVAGRGDRLRDVGKAFLRAQRRHDLGLRIELHAEAPLVIGGLGLAQAVDAARGRIAVGPRLAQRLLQLLQHMRRRRQVRIAHAEVDDVGAGVPRGRLGPVDLLEDVRRQAADAVKIFHGSSGSGNRSGQNHTAIRVARSDFGCLRNSCPIRDLTRDSGPKAAKAAPRVALNSLF